MVATSLSLRVNTVLFVKPDECMNTSVRVNTIYFVKLNVYITRSYYMATALISPLLAQFMA
jgi:hypothetical protein